ncbi:MAG: bifunctional methylenetetrahydrofolate dehydrogenase/methenyltetrahydrofolate cyclohydrolase FolD [Steroidobacteraceae bacterium]
MADSKGSAIVLDGKAVAARVRSEVAGKVRQFAATYGRAPGLAVVQVGNNAASSVYVRNKKKACAEVGIESFSFDPPDNVTRQELLGLVELLNKDQRVDGILVQLPLPAGLDANEIMDAIDPHKDVDGFHPTNTGLLAQKRPALRPCTPYGVMRLAQEYNVPLSGARATVVGASNIVGRPMALELMLAGCTVTVCHTRTKDLASEVMRGDIVVAAIGKPEMIPGEWIKPGAAVFDVGINRLADGRLVGDVDFAGAAQRAGWITPVPGGAGPMTIAMLLSNTLEAALRRTAR